MILAVIKGNFRSLDFNSYSLNPKQGLTGGLLVGIQTQKGAQQKNRPLGESEGHSK